MMIKYKNFLWIAMGLANCFMMSSSALALTVGTPITGSLNFDGNPPNFYDPANGGVPTGQGYLNASDQQNSPTVSLSNTAVEFGYTDANNTDTANFTTTGPTTTTLTIQDVSSLASAPEEQTFISNGFIGATLTQISDTFPAGNGITISGDQITFNAPQISSAGIYTAEYVINTTRVPFEFSPVSGLAIGITSFLGMRMVKKSKMAQNN
jgi:hypothetical protein